MTDLILLGRRWPGIEFELPDELRYEVDETYNFVVRERRRHSVASTG